MAQLYRHPMLAETLPTLEELRFLSTVLASPKLDGIRCTIQGNRALSRSLKLIPNMAVRAFLEKHPELEGLDGELMIHGADLNDIESVFMTRNAKLPDPWYFGVFDALPQSAGEPYSSRYARAAAAVASIAASVGAHVVMVPQVEVRSADELLQFEGHVLKMGFEGLVIRRAKSAYKHGRSTLSEGALLKWKRFADAEAEIIGFQPSKTLPSALGAFVVRDLITGVVFEVGSGVTLKQRVDFWRARKKLKGRILKYKHFAGDNKQKKLPSSVFLGLRSPDDM